MNTGALRSVPFLLGAAVSAWTWLAPVAPVAEHAVEPIGVASSSLHLELDSAAPSPGSEVRELRQVELWFTLSPQEGSVRVRVMDSQAEPLAQEPLVEDDENDKRFVLPLESPAPPGEYVVTWRAMAADGHVATGDFAVTVLLVGASQGIGVGGLEEWP